MCWSVLFSNSAVADCASRLVGPFVPAQANSICSVQFEGELEVVGDGGSEDDFVIHTASDDNCLFLSGGSTNNSVNGAQIIIGGNDSHQHGTLTLGNGDNDLSNIHVNLTAASDGTFKVRNSSTGHLWTWSKDGEVTNDATNGGSIKFAKSGTTISLQEGTAASACMGVATPNGTTPVAISTTCAASGARVFYTRVGTITDMGVISTTTNPSGTGFSFASTGASDTLASSVVYLIIKES